MYLKYCSVLYSMLYSHRSSGTNTPAALLSRESVARFTQQVGRNRGKQLILAGFPLKAIAPEYDGLYNRNPV